MPQRNVITFKSGHTIEFEDSYGNVRQAFLRYLQGSGSGNAHVCNQSGNNGSEITLDLREVASVVTQPK